MKLVEEWRLIDLGMAEPIVAQTFYEAVALAVDKGLSKNTVILVQPASPYVCLGYNQRLEEEVDVEYCRMNGFQIIRRSQGGGTTYLDSGQLFYQIVGNEKSEVILSDVNKLFERLLQTTIHVYRKLGVPAEFKPPNDVIVGGKKISGNGAGRMESSIILVGNIILDWDYDSMTRVLKVPSEKFRDKMAKSMREWLTSLKGELGYIPPVEQIKELVKESYEETLGMKLQHSTPTDKEWRIFEEEVKPRNLAHEWIHMPELRHEWLAEGRAVKIAEGVRLVSVDYKAEKMIRVTAELMEDKILDLLISGDFFMIPEENLPKLELALKGAKLSENELLRRVNKFYEETGVQTPGITSKDFADALLKAREAVERYLT